MYSLLAAIKADQMEKHLGGAMSYQCKDILSRQATLQCMCRPHTGVFWHSTDTEAMPCRGALAQAQSHGTHDIAHVDTGGQHARVFL